MGGYPGEGDDGVHVALGSALRWGWDDAAEVVPLDSEVDIGERQAPATVTLAQRAGAYEQRLIVS